MIWLEYIGVFFIVVGGLMLGYAKWLDKKPQQDNPAPFVAVIGIAIMVIGGGGALALRFLCWFFGRWF